MRGPKDKEANERHGTTDLWIRLSISEIAFSPSVGRSVGGSIATFRPFSHSSIYPATGDVKIRQKTSIIYLFSTIDKRLCCDISWRRIIYVFFQKVLIIPREFRKVM